jgi:hypothetical protein
MFYYKYSSQTNKTEFRGTNMNYTETAEYQALDEEDKAIVASFIKLEEIAEAQAREEVKRTGRPISVDRYTELVIAAMRGANKAL